ncbi:hypothetical protein FIBSPDRAFT_899170 [Athelia psychrophila]|uniref:Uncharacterized protein n=1 Tax=Athelia psychrophila TaxID=1759441 RepID=A0A166A1W1_9AGAM|nr:hypothetical protein FIBSPDRAFT_899170 [Fibularhizoctonia sp. CBS 109695]
MTEVIVGIAFCQSYARDNTSGFLLWTKQTPQEYMRAGSAQRFNEHEEVTGRCGRMSEGRAPSECMYISGVTLIKFVGVIVGVLWPTSCPEPNLVSSAAWEGAWVAGSGNNSVEDVPHEAAAAAEADMLARSNL